MFEAILTKTWGFAV